MKYSIAGFSQQKLIEHGIDLTDAHILRWILDFMPNMKKHTANEKQYVWFKQSYFLQEMPVCGIKSRQGLDKRLVRLSENGFLEKMHINHKGGRCCYLFLTEKVGDLVTQSHDNHGLHVEGTHDNQGLRGHDNHSLQGHDNQGLHARDSSINHSSISNSSITPQGGKPKKPSVDDLKPKDVSNEVWQDFKTHRKQFKAAITATALNGFKKQADQAKISIQEAMEHSILMGWRGFKADWYQNQKNKTTKTEDEPTW